MCILLVVVVLQKLIQKVKSNFMCQVSAFQMVREEGEEEENTAVFEVLSFKFQGERRGAQR